ncbi:MAG: hypothetical protein PHN31_03050 [Candidatus Gracilibacteria bacterium]|nr:hypothetical protein [Candidatus Gracilibacteria bacterium]
MLKKLMSFFVLVILLTNSLNFVFASELSYVSATQSSYKLDYYKGLIQKSKNGSVYLLKLKKVEQTINAISDMALLNRINSRIQTKKGSVSDTLTLNLLNYISALVDSRIAELNSIEAENVLNLLDNPSLTSEEISLVDSEIVKLQLGVLDTSKQMIDTFVSNLKKNLNVEEKGNFKISLDGSGSFIGSVKAQLNLKDYTALSSNFDSELDTQLDLLLDASLVGGKTFNTQLSSFVKFVSKDGNIYMLFDKLNYSGLENVDTSGEIKKVLEILKNLASNNEYLKIQNDQASINLIEMMKSFNTNSLYSSADKLLSESLFKAYKKDGNKYYILPTKRACDSMKYVYSKLGGYGSSTCSTSEYNSLLKEIISSGDLYLVLDGTTKYLGFDFKDYSSEGSLKVYFTSGKIDKITFLIEAVMESLKGNKIEFSFVNGKSIDFIAAVPSEDTEIKFNALLTSLNKINEITYTGKYGDYFDSSFSYKNNVFNGKFNYTKAGKIVTSGTLTGSYDATNKILKSLNFNLNSDKSVKKYAYNEKTMSYDFNTIPSKLSVNYSLLNQKITGKISYKEGDIELYSMNSNGTYRKDYFELNNSLSAVNSYSSDKTTGTINIKYVGNYMSNTGNFYFEVNSSYGFLKLELDSNINRVYKDGIEINVPEKYKNVNDVFSGSVNSYMY